MEHPSSSKDSSSLKVSPASLLCALHHAHIYNSTVPSTTFAHQQVRYRQRPYTIQTLHYEPSNHSLVIQTESTVAETSKTLTIATATEAYQYAFYFSPQLCKHQLFHLHTPPLITTPLQDTPTNCATSLSLLLNPDRPILQQYPATALPTHVHLNAPTAHQLLRFYLPFLHTTHLPTTALHITLQPFWPAHHTRLHYTFPFVLTTALHPTIHQGSDSAPTLHPATFGSEILHLPLRTPTPQSPTLLYVQHDMLTHLAQAILFDLLWPTLQRHWQLVRSSPPNPVFKTAHYPLILLNALPGDTLQLVPNTQHFSDLQNSFNLDTIRILYNPLPPYSTPPIPTTPPSQPQPPPTPLPPPNIQPFLDHLQTLLNSTLSC